jgi:hypothetical protein
VSEAVHDSIAKLDITYLMHDKCGNFSLVDQIRQLVDHAMQEGHTIGLDSSNHKNAVS